MGTRELIILLLGLAVIALILRGLYVAMQARRGQIRLAIDKNIPTDVDLDALELSELPNGGARVVARNLSAVNLRNEQLDRASGPVGCRLAGPPASGHRLAGRRASGRCRGGAA